MQGDTADTPTATKAYLRRIERFTKGLADDEAPILPMARTGGRDSHRLGHAPTCEERAQNMGRADCHKRLAGLKGAQWSEKCSLL